MTGGEPFGILGGTFDPIHLGHLAVARAAGEALGLERILLVPARNPPHRDRPTVSSYHRFAMVALAAMTAGALQASDLDLEPDRPSYTWDLLDHLEAGGAKTLQMVFIAGADAFAEIASWRGYPAILDRCHFAVVSRPGATMSSFGMRMPELEPRFTRVGGGQAAARQALAMAETPRIFLIESRTPDVSSTEIRRRAGDQAALTDLVPASVAAYVLRHGLYADD